MFRVVRIDVSREDNSFRVFAEDIEVYPMFSF
mgnify:CR=1 FL=1